MFDSGVSVRRNKMPHTLKGLRFKLTVLLEGKTVNHPCT